MISFAEEEEEEELEGRGTRKCFCQTGGRGEGGRRWREGVQEGEFSGLGLN